MWEEIRLAQPPHWNPWNSKVISSIAVVLRAQNGLMNKLGLKSSMNRSLWSLHTFIVNVLPLNWGGGVIRDVVARYQRYQLPHQSGILREKVNPEKQSVKLVEFPSLRIFFCFQAREVGQLHWLRLQVCLWRGCWKRTWVATGRDDAGYASSMEVLPLRLFVVPN